MVFHNFLGSNFFFGRTPRWAQRVIYWVFGPLGAAGTWRNSGPGSKTEKHNFPEIGVPKRKKKVTTPSGMVVRHFVTFYVLTDQTSTGGKTRNTGILGHFGLGRPLALGEIPSPGQKRKIAISWCWGAGNEKKVTTLCGVSVTF